MTLGLATLLAALALRQAQGAPVPQAQGARSAALPAAEASRAAPVRVDADEVHYAFQKREVTFTGKNAKPVTMTRDDATLTCRKLVARTDEAGRIVTAACSGDVRFTRGARVVTCDRATFEAALDRVTCEGDPVLRDGSSEVKAMRLVYELKTDEAKAEGAKVTLPGDEVERRRRELDDRRKGRKP
jgi:lipopolysaccharide export system protein LptA